MSTRIRYKRNAEGSYVSPEYITTNGIYIAQFNNISVSVHSVNKAVTGEIVSVSPIHVTGFTGASSAKKWIKSTLKSVGVNFLEEARNKKVPKDDMQHGGEDDVM